MAAELGALVLEKNTSGEANHWLDVFARLLHGPGGAQGCTHLSSHEARQRKARWASLSSLEDFVCKEDVHLSGRLWKGILKEIEPDHSFWTLAVFEAVKSSLVSWIMWREQRKDKFSVPRTRVASGGWTEASQHSTLSIRSRFALEKWGRELEREKVLFHSCLLEKSWSRSRIIHYRSEGHLGRELPLYTLWLSEIQTCSSADYILDRAPPDAQQYL